MNLLISLCSRGVTDAMRYAEEPTEYSRDFTRRRRFPTSGQYSAVFVAFYLLVLGTFYFAKDIAAYGGVTLVWVAIVAGVVAYSIQSSRDVMLATEYQNAIFASAIGTQSVFSLIARADGSTVYIDRGVQKLFPQFARSGSRDLQTLFALSSVPDAHRDRILQAVETMQPLRQLITMTTDVGKELQMIITVETITFPKPFAVVRARHFVDRTAQAPSVHQATKMLPPVALLTQFANTLPSAVLMTDPKGAVIFANAAFERMTGYSESALVQAQADVSSLVRPEAGALRPMTGALHVTKASGEMGVVQGSVSEIMQDNDMVAALIVLQPMSASASAPSIPQVVATQELEQFVATAPIAMVQLAEDGSVQQANEAFHVLTQGTLRTKLPANMLDLVAQDKRTEAAETFRKLLHQVPTSPQALELALPNGETVSASLYVSAAPAEGARIWYLVDVTEQKNLEHRFAHSQKMQAVGQLAGGVAHDFNNLLTAMIGFCDLLLMRHPAGDQSFADIMQIKQNANRAANLVRQLLAFSRRQTLQPVLLDITDVLAELSNLIRRLIGENIELKMVHGRNLGMVKADQGQLEQVIINLAVNARDAMKGGGELGIVTSLANIDSRFVLPSDYVAPIGEEALLPQGEYIVVEVTDNGTGIEPAVMEKIFEPFFSTKEVGSGTGLGLATVFGIIKQSGGYIFVRSSVGAGTTFSLFFPRHQAEAVAASTPETQGDKSLTGDLTGVGTILLVEDETPVRTFAARALRNKGYTVIEADCGETGLDIFRNHEGKFDLIVTDVIMPGMNGPTMVDTIHQTHPDIRVVFISGYAEDIFMNNYGAERSFNFLAKPFTLKQLASKVKDVLTGK